MDGLNKMVALPTALTTFSDGMIGAKSISEQVSTVAVKICGIFTIIPSKPMLSDFGEMDGFISGLTSNFCGASGNDFVPNSPSGLNKT